MKIALIRPNMGDYRAGDAMPPLAMGILAARSGSHSVVFYDDRVEVIPLDLEADLIAFSVETFTARRAYQLADHYRAQGKTVVMGGYHPTFLPEEALLHADAVIQGDAEGVWEELLQDVEQNNLKKIYQNNNLAPLTNNFMDRSIFKDKRYLPVELIQYTRGCRFACDFCSIHEFYEKVRIRPIESFLEELSALNSKRFLIFVDDNLFGNAQSLSELLLALKPLKFRWGCQISIDVARDTHLLDQLAEAGCRYVLIGFESLDPVNLKQMRKSWNSVSGDYLKVAANLHQRGISIYGTFVFGYDNDTADSCDRSLEFALEAKLDIANFNLLTPTPGSMLYQRLEQTGRLISPKWWVDPNYHYGDPIFEPLKMDAFKLAEKCYQVKKDFYSWGSIGRRLFDFKKSASLPDRGITAMANIISHREIQRKQGKSLGAHP